MVVVSYSQELTEKVIKISFAGLLPEPHLDLYLGKKSEE